MWATPFLICLVLVSIAQAALVTRIPKPKLNLVNSQQLESPEIPKHKSPEERRKLSLFPKSYMKYVISSEPIYKIATHKPMVHQTKKPLMKKLRFHDRKSKVEENETEQPIPDKELMYENNLAVSPKEDTVLVSEEIGIEVIEDKSEESYEKENDNSDEEDKVQNDPSEIKTVTADKEIKESKHLKDEDSSEHNHIEAFSDVSDSTKNSKEIETPDWTEFILVDPAHKPTKSEKISSEEEYVTTEFYEEPEIIRQKRGSNVIEEENLASTVAGYKYTWKDTRLNNDVAFKNIHS